jgi:hypothetical protein
MPDALNPASLLRHLSERGVEHIGRPQDLEDLNRLG